jgi:hypothetical protein
MCPVDTYAIVLGTENCLSCPENADSPSGSNPGYSRSSWGPLYGLSSEHVHVCMVCPVNTYTSALSSATCSACPENSVSASGSNASSSCLCFTSSTTGQLEGLKRCVL